MLFILRLCKHQTECFISNSYKLSTDIIKKHGLTLNNKLFECTYLLTNVLNTGSGFTLSSLTNFVSMANFLYLVRYIYFVNKSSVTCSSVHPVTTVVHLFSQD